MDLHYDNPFLRLPQEVVGCIVLDLSLASDIRSIRLVNRAFNIAGTDLMIPAVPDSPSTLFTTSIPGEVERLERAQPFQTLHRQTRTLLTVWT